MARTTGSGDDKHRQARRPDERAASPGRDPQRQEAGRKRLQADAATDQPMPKPEDRDDEFPER
jgi:hypothetical protein